jgi:hypothetical protein
VLSLETIKTLIQRLSARAEICKPADALTIETDVHGIAVTLPEDYIAFMLITNGLEGAIGEEGYVVILPIEEVAELNDAYEVMDLAPGLVLFGSDGDSIGYGFDTRSNEAVVVSISLIGMGWDGVEERWVGFLSMLQALSSL